MTKRFGGLTAIDNVSFQMGRDDGPISPNGAGKTTLVRMMMGILKTGRRCHPLYGVKI